LHPLPAKAIWGVGPKTNEQLEKLGLRTVGEIANTPRSTLIRALGEATGSSLYELAWGRDYRDVVSDEPEKSISAAETFASDLDDPEEILREFLRLCEKATLRMRQAGFCAKTISIKVRFADFKTITRSKTLDQPISGTKESFEVAKKLYQDLKIDRARIRMVGVSLEGLILAQDSSEQLLLGQRDIGWRQADSAIDRVKAKFGRASVRPARLVSPSDED
jgi:DNA polymerase IV